MIYKGSCLCNSVQYEIDGEIGPLTYCHCSRCRKVNGTAFSAAVLIPKEEFKIVSGQESLKEYESSLGVYRVFCGTCASPLFSKRDAMPESVRLRVGTLDTKITSKVVAHCFVADKAEWYDICDDAPQYAERP